MENSYRALCSGFYVNLTLTTRMDLPLRRESVLDLFERLRKEYPRLERFRRYRNELALESFARHGEQQWIALRKTTVRAGYVDPPAFADAKKLHASVLELAPFYLSINPLDVESLELMFGFDLDAVGNHNAIVYEALVSKSPLAKALDADHWSPIDIQPNFGVALNEKGDLQAFFEVKTRSTPREIRTGRYTEQPISVCLSIRKGGPLRDVKDLGAWLDLLVEHGQKIAIDRVVPHILQPIREAIASSSA